MAIHELRAKRASVYDNFKALAEKADFNEETDGKTFADLKREVEALDGQIKRTIEAQELAAKTAVAVEGQEPRRAPAAVKDDPWTIDADAARRGLGTSKGLIAGGLSRILSAAGGNPWNMTQAAKSLGYGERHPLYEAVSKALTSGVGASGGFIVPPEYVNEIIELLRPRAVVRAAGPRTMPMPRGTMTLPAQTSAATASYSGETSQINASQQALGQIVATYKKLTALVPITNDLMRYADPAADAFVRDDLVKVIALREDLAFLLGDGTQDSPTGFLWFAVQNAIANGGSAPKYTVAAQTTFSTALNWATGAANSSTAAAGGNFITSTEGSSATLTTVANELAGLVNKLDTANVPDIKRRWFFHPRIFNYLNNLLNSLGVYVYRDELSKGTLLGYPFSKSTQIPVNVNDAGNSQSNCTFIFLVEMDDALLLDSMSLELAISREGTYYDATGVLQSAFQKDQTLVRAITEHDFQMRHLPSIAIDQFVTWTPAIS